ncbi:adenylate/guanylate cyclase domain-containing protein [Motiliproteus sp. SC1-56]|uniref:adenylate/guanylate cyclase domain-containing protein n=1 Tax=Motiliproteus sp. SC1-56 TaxID=2799565 RepID=UPI001A905B99
MIAWLLREGRLLPDAATLTAALGRRLLEAGLPVDRVRVSLRTLNPLVVGRAFTWWQDRDAVEVFNPPHSILDSPDYLGSPIEAVHRSARPYRCRLAQTPPGSQHQSLEVLRARGTTDYLALALRFNQDPVPGPWILSSRAPGGFNDADVEKLQRIAHALAPVLEVHALTATTRSLLDTYLGPRSGQRVFDGQVRRGDGERIQAAIWYSDMRNSTGITETLPLEQLLELLNRHFEVISDAVRAEGGEVLRFIGDALLVVFAAAPGPSLQAACNAALRAATKARRAMAAVNQELQGKGLPEVHYGLGLDVGEVVYGNVGARDRLDFTVMGRAVNRAARIETLTKVTGRELLASAPFARQVGNRLGYVGEFPVAGMEAPLQVFGLREPDQSPT